jgi:Big-like domain-containing protein
LTATSRFVVPTVVNGKVYIGSKTQLMVYGLMPTLTASAGANQTGIVRSVLPIPLSIQTADAYSLAPLPGVTVTCKDGGAGGIFSSAVTASPSTGLVTGTYTLPTKVKNVTITCTAPGFASAVFPETSIAGPPHVIRIFSGSKQTGPVNTPLPIPLVATVVDSFSNPLPGVAVTFSDGGKGGSFSSASAVSDASGHVSTVYTTGSMAGIIHVSATVAGIKAAVFTVTVTAQ